MSHSKTITIESLLDNLLGSELELLDDELLDPGIIAHNNQIKQEKAEATQAIQSYIDQKVTEARIDENDIWLAHSTSRVIDNDDKPAIRSSDFKDRIKELSNISKGGLDE